MIIPINWITDLPQGVVGDRTDLISTFFWRNSMPISCPYYYISHYACPHCSNALLFEMRCRDSIAAYQDRMLRLYNVYTCPECRRFYGSILEEGADLRKYALESQKYSESEYFETLVKTTAFNSEKYKNLRGI